MKGLARAPVKLDAARWQSLARFDGPPRRDPTSVTVSEEPPLLASHDAAWHLAPDTLDSCAAGGLVTPARTDPDGTHWWVLHAAP